MRPSVRVTFVIVVLVALFPAPPTASAPAEPMPPDIVLILTDDQRWDTLWAMPTVQSELVAYGITFSSAFATTPTCCPSRASILTGQYAHSTQVYTNRPPYGGFSKFVDASTLATWLDDAGYRTGLIGKYLNRYSQSVGSYVPPGWDRWFAILQQAKEPLAGYYYNYKVSDEGSVISFGSSEADYSTDVLAAKADDFIRTADPTEPLFLYFSVVAPHGPPRAAARHSDAFSDLLGYRPPNYNEADVSDKPAYLQQLPLMTDATQASVDRFRRKQYMTLLAVDEAVATLIAALSDTGRLANTMIVFASDNGMSWGEHRRYKEKLVPYEESIRIPLVIRYDAMLSSPWTRDHLVANLDLAPTFAELAGVTASGAEGQSLLPLLTDPSVPWRSEILFEHVIDKNQVPTYCGIRNEGFLYVTYSTAEEELYDLALDPYQIDNRAGDSAYGTTLMNLRTQLVQLCDPVPPGFTFPYDAVLPTPPTDLSAMPMRSSQVDLSWSAASDDVGVAGYTIYRDGLELATVDGATLTYSDTSVAPATTYTYAVDAFDGAGNHSAQSNQVTVTTPDDVAPAAPTDLFVVGVSSDQVDLAWSAATDDVGVAGYTVYRDGVELATVDGATLTYSDTSVAPATTYTYAVDAFDGAGNHSAQSNQVTVTTLEGMLARFR